jgi:hypothetical protein
LYQTTELNFKNEKNCWSGPHGRIQFTKWTEGNGDVSWKLYVVHFHRLGTWGVTHRGGKQMAFTIHHEKTPEGDVLVFWEQTKYKGRVSMTYKIPSPICELSEMPLKRRRLVRLSDADSDIDLL